MKKLLKFLGVVFAGILMAVGITLIYLFVSLPKSEPAAAIRIEATPQRLERGEYLAVHVTGCIACHSMRNSKYYSEPVAPGTEGQGSMFIKDPQFGTLVAPNITPTALRDWTDGEILRAITSGVNRQGRPLFPIMPYPEFATMSREDLYSVIVYIRSLPSRNAPTGQTQLKFPLNLIVRTIPKPAAIQEKPPANRGDYLTRIASCRTCHTPQNDRGQKLPGMDFAGGMVFTQADGTIVRSLNITPDAETGIGKWSRDQFISVFKRYESVDLQQIPVDKGNTVMPWTLFAGMTTEDLGAIYDYLRTIKPVRQNIENKAR